MSVSIVELTTKHEWDSAVLQFAEANFLQSFEWGVFQQKLGKKVWYISIQSDGVVVGLALTVKEAAKRGAYLTVAGGPLLRSTESAASAKKIVSVLFEHLKTLSHQEHCVFIRFRPQLLDTPEVRNLFESQGAKVAPMHLTADLTLQLDLTKPEEQLLAEMRKNTRYEVRRAEKEGVTVTTSTDPEEIETFYDHQVVLAKKHNFVPFGKRFLKEQFAVFAAQGSAQLFHSYKDGQLLASAFVLIYNKEAVYHYGISTPANDRLPGSYACQWAAIQFAKAHGCTRYNFWGIAPESEKSHRFAGVSVFKRGFGGEEVAYLPAHDLPTSPLYTVVNWFETIRKKMRRL